VFLRQGNLGLLLQRYKSIYNINTMALDAEVFIPDAYIGDIILFPAIDWGFRFQRPQHLALQLGARGYRVFYVSTVPMLIFGSGGYIVQDNPVKGVVLVQLSSGKTRIPDFYKENLTTDEVAGFLKAYAALCANFGIVSPAILIQHPFWWPLVACLNRSRLVYDCLDYHAGFHDESNSKLLEHEKQLANKADVVVVTSSVLADSFQRPRNCRVIRNGCEFDIFNQANRVKNQSRGPIIGYVGAVSSWFDGELLFKVARERPDWQFDIYGAIVDADISLARTLSNVNFFGEIVYENVPYTIARFDVCIIPFKLNSLTLATNPVKIYEYLAVGRPVVSTALPELAEMEEVDVFCSDSIQNFILAIEKAILLSDQPERIAARKVWANHNDWSIRVEDLVEAMDLK
jgi:glycosyltransferase involved in cell wall biosynthesis